MTSSELWWSVGSLWEAIQKAQIARLSQKSLPAGPFWTGELSSNHVLDCYPSALAMSCELKSCRSITAAHSTAC
jgi:hypothetical protein